MPPTRMPRIEAIFPELCQVYYGALGVWQFHWKPREFRVASVSATARRALR